MLAILDKSCCRPVWANRPAGFVPAGSEPIRTVCSRETLGNPRIQEAIAGRVRPRMRRLAMSVENTIWECGALAFNSISPQVMTEDGQLRPLEDWPPEHVQAIIQLLGLKAVLAIS